MIETSYSSSRSFDASKYIYNQSATQASKVSEFMRSSLDAAVNNIIGASDQSVLIDGAGIQLRDPNGNTELRLVNNMIGMTDDGWQTAKLALGEFTVGDSSYFGINAEVIGGKLIVGNNLVIENETDNGVMQFKVDSTGAWLNNSTMVIQGNSTGGILLDPKYGIIAGSSDGANGNFFKIDGTTVTPSFIDSDGNIEYDKNKMPKNSNFYLDKDSGNAYFRGNVYATDGVFNGSVYATDGEFKGVVQASTFKDQNGKSMLTGDYKFNADYLSLKGLEIVNKGGDTTFEVDSSGNVTINGTVTMDKDSSINWSCVEDKPTYIESTYIDFSKVSSPSIEGNFVIGGEVYGGSFHDTKRLSRLTLSADRGTAADLIYKKKQPEEYGGDKELFKIYDGATRTDIHLGGHIIGWSSVGSSDFHPQGTWNFSSANVKGVVAKFG